MISFSFSARHWQQIEAGRPITVRTLLRIGEIFGVSLSSLVSGLDSPGEKKEEEPRPVGKVSHKGKKRGA
jgi:transcriptional regulator with XRE-family HTH domain